MLSVSCVNCYVKGQAHATLTVSPDFNISSALKIFAEKFITEVDNITETVWDTFKNWTEVVVKNTTDVIEYDLEACTIKITSGHCKSSHSCNFGTREFNHFACNTKILKSLYQAMART